MAKIVMEIPDDEYKRWIEEGLMDALIVRNALRDGIPLEKVFEDIRKEIQNLPVTYPFYDHLEPFVCQKDVLNIVDKHIGKESIDGKDSD